MTLVVLLRGANLGKRRFSPKALAEALADFDLVNIGAAGTFVVPKRVAEKTLRERVQAELPWEAAEMVILKEAEVRDALAAGEKVKVPDGARKFGLALPKAPAKAPAMPLEALAKDGAWGMRYEALSGRVAIGVRRRFDETGTYSTKEVDAALGSDRGTMRDWPTWEKIGKAMDGE
jgi:hypothetical protein